MNQTRKVWLVAGSRTPIGSFGKSLRSASADKLATHTIKNVLRRSGVDANALDGIILGHGYQSSYAPNTARVAAQEAGIPDSVPAMTVQRQCGSGMEAVNIAMDKIQLGRAELMIAGGVESMSTIPYLIPGKARWKGFFAKRFPKIVRLGPLPVLFGTADNGIVPTKLVWDLKTNYMSGTAQRVADTYDIARQESDAYALRSQELANQAVKSGRLDVEIDPIEIPGRGFFARDEHPRETSLEKLAALKPILKTRQITAGNSSGINDGACSLVLASDKKVKELGLTPLAQLVDHVVVGVDYEQMGIGPVLAINKLLEQNKLTLVEIDLIEINEAFAAQYLACEKLLKLDRNKVNVNGGAIALGHPIGMSGARLILTLAHELKNRGLKRGIAALCIGGGMGIATLLELP